MSGYKGRDFVLKEGDGEVSETFAAVAGGRTKGLSIDGEAVEITNDGSAGKRTLLDGAGTSSLSISFDGVVLQTGGSRETTIANLRARAEDRSINNYQMDDGIEVIEGAFQVTSYEETGEHNGELSFSATLESSGDWTIT